MAFDVRKLPAAITYRLIVGREFGQIFAKSGENNGNKLPMCPTLSNDRVPHLDRWMEQVLTDSHFSSAPASYISAVGSAGHKFSGLN